MRHRGLLNEAVRHLLEPSEPRDVAEFARSACGPKTTRTALLDFAYRYGDLDASARWAGRDRALSV